jgi:hypothetical protein
VLSVCQSPSGPCSVGTGEGSDSVVGSGAGSTIVWTPDSGSSLVAMYGSVVITYAATDSRGAQGTGTLTINCRSLKPQQVH